MARQRRRRNDRFGTLSFVEAGRRAWERRRVGAIDPLTPADLAEEAALELRILAAAPPMLSPTARRVLARQYARDALLIAKLEQRVEAGRSRSWVAAVMRSIRWNALRAHQHLRLPGHALQGPFRVTLPASPLPSSSPASSPPSTTGS